MMTPSFWARRGLPSLLLSPLSALYAIGIKCNRATAQHLPIPVICIGNATAGGAGKTPTALAAGRILKEKGINAFFLSRGYGRKTHGTLRVDTARHTSRDVGDEPLLLAQMLPTIVAANRITGADEAISHGAEAIIMDDGFQNPSLHKNLSLLVIDSHYGFGNGLLLPAGPLREPASAAIARADAIIIIGNGVHVPALPLGKKILRAKLLPKAGTESLMGKRVFAFCGLAHPQKFFYTLEDMGAVIVGCKSYADHAPYNETQIKALATMAGNEDALLVTTSKDAARMDASMRALVTVIDVELTFDNAAEFLALLEGVMA